MSSDFKYELKSHCIEQMLHKKALLVELLNHLSEAANNETKNSAGDKHETAKAHLQIEQEKVGKQLSELEEQIRNLDKIILHVNQPKIVKGSLVETENGTFFIAAAFGKILFRDQEIFVISEQSPLGKLMLHKKAGEMILLNNRKYVIKSIN